MKTAFIITLSIVFGVGLSLLILRMIFASTRKKLEDHLQKKYDKNEIIAATTSANFFGLQSKGVKQARGNGALILTRKELCFIRALPFKEFIIPLSSVLKISLPTAFNGKSVFSKLLCIHFQTHSDFDAMAWAVKNPEAWKQSIEKWLPENR